MKLWIRGYIRNCDICGEASRYNVNRNGKFICRMCYDDHEGDYGSRLDDGFGLMSLGDDSIESEGWGDEDDEETRKR